MSQSTATLVCPTDEVVLPEARGGRKPGLEVVLEVVRVLQPNDLQALGEAAPSPSQRLSRVRASHHALAQILATGVSNAEASARTGYSPAYISSLQNDPAFQELMQHYAVVTEEIFVDTVKQMQMLGQGVIGELQQRLDENPGKFTNRELTEIMETTVVKPMQRGQGTQGGPGSPTPGGFSIEVKFRAANPDNQILDITPEAAE